MRVRLLTIGVVLGLVSMLGSLVVFQPERAEAFSGSDFDPGFIISDEYFYDDDAMSQAEIQSFLNEKIGSCANSNCLNVYRMSTPTVAREDYCDTYQGAANEPASAIIYKVQKACKISAKVILVTLQKEQSLVTRTSPSDGILRKAMGMGCPDTSVCDAEYYGFFNQVYAAARQFNRYNNGSFTTRYKVGSHSSVLFNPNASCGSSSVFIKNKATAALYYYTPYQPNASALANLRGSGDACGAYGNRNFWVYFSDWFGSTHSPGPAAIESAYRAAGGETGALGAAATDYVNITAKGGGLVKAYANGAITWTPQFGAAVISGDIRTYFNGQGGIDGWIGWPASSASSVGTNGGGLVQGFQNAAVTWSGATGAQSLRGGLRKAFNELGGLSGPLGWPNAAMTCAGKPQICSQSFQGGVLTTPSSGGASTFTSPAIEEAFAASGGTNGPLGKPVNIPSAILLNGGGFVQPYANGAIAWSFKGGAHAITGAVRTAFNAAGGIGGKLGWPTGDQSCDANKLCTQMFQGGQVSTSPTGGAVMNGAILALHTAMGGAAGSLGSPIGGSNAVADNGGGVVQAFANGAITWTSGTGAIAITGEIRAAYNRLGGLSGSFGWPVTSASTNGKGLVQGFQNGAIVSNASLGTHSLWGPIRQTYAENGGLDGWLGWPASGRNVFGDGFVQGFENGAITLSPDKSSFVISGELREAYGTFGGVTGSLGWPASSPISVDAHGGGKLQGFENGAITWTKTSGGIKLSGGIRSFFNAQGGVTGTLGWPTSQMSCSSSSSCSQSFQGGTIDWTQAGGPRLR